MKLSDLYSMKLNADMIVLSACETGLGKVLQGEGAISLARAFAFAGAKSVVTTLWSVENTSTSKLMAEFYNALANGKEKDEAMKLAREEYLKNVPASWRHPFFWLGIIVIGDTSPISMH
ncbi:MAG: CHAT domain-containing protein [Saprospiraceae bacterium]